MSLTRKHLTRAVLAASALVLLMSGALIPAAANGGPLQAGSVSAATVGTSSTTVLSANVASLYLEFINVSATATICLQAGTAAATIATAQCAAGEIPLPPLAHETLYLLQQMSGDGSTTAQWALR